MQQSWIKNSKLWLRRILVTQIRNHRCDRPACNTKQPNMKRRVYQTLSIDSWHLTVIDISTYTAHTILPCSRTQPVTSHLQKHKHARNEIWSTAINSPLKLAETEHEWRRNQGHRTLDLREDVGQEFTEPTTTMPEPPAQRRRNHQARKQREGEVRGRENRRMPAGLAMARDCRVLPSVLALQNPPAP
jgi:hypothetical protein